MSTVFVISDPHFNAPNVRYIPGRKEWAEGMSIEEHDQKLIDNWNSVVGKRDVVWLLGDIGHDKPRGYLKGFVVAQLQGTIKVIGGNHDTARVLQDFATDGHVHGAVSKSIAGYRCMLTHIPIHPQEMWWDLNIHGHLHANTVKRHATHKEHREIGPSDPRYLNVCCEHLGYTPQPIEELVRQRMER